MHRLSQPTPQDDESPRQQTADKLRAVAEAATPSDLDIAAFVRPMLMRRRREGATFKTLPKLNLLAAQMMEQKK